MCPSAAESLIEKDSRFKIVSPLILNSDIFVIKKGVQINNVKKIGISTNRDYQSKMVKDKFGENCDVIPMLGSSLPYAMEKGIVDGLLIDYVKAEQIEGEKYPSYLGTDNVNYVLVTSTKFEKDLRYKEFLEALEVSIENFNKEEVEAWNKFKIKLILTIPKENY